MNDTTRPRLTPWDIALNIVLPLAGIGTLAWLLWGSQFVIPSGQRFVGYLTLAYIVLVLVWELVTLARQYRRAALAEVDAR